MFVVWTLSSSVLDGRCKVSTRSLVYKYTKASLGVSIRQAFTELAYIQSKNPFLAAQIILSNNLNNLTEILKVDFVYQITTYSQKRQTI